MKLRPIRTVPKPADTHHFLSYLRAYRWRLAGAALLVAVAVAPFFFLRAPPTEDELQRVCESRCGARGGVSVPDPNYPMSAKGEQRRACRCNGDVLTLPQ